MRQLPREAWGYAVLLIILFAIATLAVWETISYLEELISPDQYKVVIVLIWSLTLGFMLIAGAFGLWTIQFSAEAESRRRIGRLIDAMDYLSDGLLAVDKKDRITGSNPAARNMVDSMLAKQEPMKDVFPCLSDEDISTLLRTKEPNEVERKLVSANVSRTLRFRSQPSEGLTLILISDVTTMIARHLRSRQIARLQLIGQLARGVAHDFNNLLCGISGHASLLARIEPGSPETDISVEAITSSAEKGIALAGHLLELSQPGIAEQFTDLVQEHVMTAVEILRHSLSGNWQVESVTRDQLPSVALTGIQVEQVIMNLGLLAADASDNPGVLRIMTARPGKNYLFNVSNEYAGVVLIAATGPDVKLEDLNAKVTTSESAHGEASRESGVILSIIRSMLEEAGGALECLTGTDVSLMYRVCLPLGNILADKKDTSELPEELEAYIANWTVLLAKPARQHTELDKRLDELGVKVESVDNIMSVLARVEESKDLDAMVLDKYLLGQEVKGLLRAILKLHPSVGIVVICEGEDSDLREELSADVVLVPAHSEPNKILTAMIEARSLAARRKSA